MTQPRAPIAYPLYVWIFFGVLGALRAQTDSFARTLWKTQDGLPEDIVQSLTQDHDGYLWIATTEGLTLEFTA